MAAWRDRVDDAASAVSKALSSAVKWTRKEGGDLGPRIQHQRDIARLRKQQRQLIRKRNRLFIHMGAKVHSLHQKGKVKNADLLDMCEQVDETAAELAAKKEEITAAEEEFTQRGELETELQLAAKEEEKGIEAEEPEEDKAEPDEAEDDEPGQSKPADEGDS